MKLPIYFGLPKRLSRQVLIRRVSGDSMLPRLRAGTVVIAISQPQTYTIGNVVIISHDNIDKIKRVSDVRTTHDGLELFVRGDNSEDSTDSRQFGWLPNSVVIGRVIWPRKI